MFLENILPQNFFFQENPFKVFQWKMYDQYDELFIYVF